MEEISTSKVFQRPQNLSEKDFLAIMNVSCRGHSYPFHLTSMMSRFYLLNIIKHFPLYISCPVYNHISLHGNECKKIPRNFVLSDFSVLYVWHESLNVMKPSFIEDIALNESVIIHYDCILSFFIHKRMLCKLL